MEDLADSARFLHRRLGRVPTNDELVVEMIDSMSTDRSFLAKSKSSTPNDLV